MSGPVPIPIPPAVRQQLGTMPDRCLAALAAHPHGVTTREIAAALGVTRQGAHAALVTLAHRGVVRREQLPKITPYMRPPVRWHAAKKEPVCIS